MEDNLYRLLRLTKDNNSPVIQDLRKEIIKYAKNTQEYISEIEIDNFEITIKYFKMLNDYKLMKMTLETLDKHFFNDKSK